MLIGDIEVLVKKNKIEYPYRVSIQDINRRGERFRNGRNITVIIIFA